MQDSTASFFLRLLETPTLIFVGGFAVAIIAIVCGTIRSTIVARARERTRRELAAYVAEGTIDPDKAVRMLNAGASTESDVV